MSGNHILHPFTESLAGTSRFPEAFSGDRDVMTRSGERFR
jgi:hypothetical protein